MLNQYEINKNNQIEHFFILAQMACKGNNFREANKYYTKILEINSKNIHALLGKCFSIGMQSTTTKNTTKEAEFYFTEFFNSIQKAIDINNIDSSSFFLEKFTNGWNPMLCWWIESLFQLGLHLHRVENSISKLRYHIHDRYKVAIVSFKIISFAYLYGKDLHNRGIIPKCENISYVDVFNCARDLIDISHQYQILYPEHKYSQTHQEVKFNILNTLKMLDMMQHIRNDFPTWSKLQEL